MNVAISCVLAVALQSEPMFIVEESADDVLAYLRSGDKFFLARQANLPERFGVEVVPQLIAALDHSEMQVRAHAAEWLGIIGPKSHEAIPALLRLARKKAKVTKEERGPIMPWETSLDRSNALLALARTGPNNARVIKCLTESLSDPLTQMAATDALRQLGPKGAAAIPQLAKAVAQGSRNLNFDVQAAQALGAIGGAGLEHLVELTATNRVAAIAGLEVAGSPAIPVVIKAMSNVNEQKRAVLVAALGSLQKHDGVKKTVESALLKCLADDCWSVRSEAVQAFEKSKQLDGPLVLAVSRMLKDPVRALRRQAAQTIGKLGQRGRPAVFALVDALGDQSEGVCKDAAIALGKLGPHASGAVSALLRLALDDPDDEIRNTALEALGGVGPKARGAVPALIDLFEKTAWHDVHKYVPICKALGGIGPSAFRAAPTLRAQLPKMPRTRKDNAPTTEIALGGVKIKGLDTRRDKLLAIAGALGRIGDDSPDAILILLRDIEDRGISEARESASALAEFGPSARIIFSDLLSLLRKEEHPFTKGDIARLMASIGPGRVEDVRAVLELLPKSSIFEGEHLAKALYLVDPDLAKATPALITACDANSFDMRARVLVALGRIGPAAKEAIPLLSRSLNKDEPFPVRFSAAWSLVQIGADSETKERTRPILQAGASQNSGYTTTEQSTKEFVLAKAADDPVMRVLAVGALVQISEMKTDQALPILIEGLNLDSNLARRHAVRVLKDLGTDARPALPRLLDAAFDRDPIVRHEAASAAKRIDAKAAAEAEIP